jgi:hypothetical protein
MAKSPEARFYAWIARNQPGQTFFDRIENSVGSGIPDLVVGAYGKNLFVELKAIQKHTHQVTMRGVQYAWMHKMAYYGSTPLMVWCFVEDTATIRVYLFPFTKKLTKQKGYVKITSQPIVEIPRCRFWEWLRAYINATR